MSRQKWLTILLSDASTFFWGNPIKALFSVMLTFFSFSLSLTFDLNIQCFYFGAYEIFFLCLDCVPHDRRSLQLSKSCISLQLFEITNGRQKDEWNQA